VKSIEEVIAELENAEIIVPDEELTLVQPDVAGAKEPEAASEEQQPVPELEGVQQDAVNSDELSSVNEPAIESNQHDGVPDADHGQAGDIPSQESPELIATAVESFESPDSDDVSIETGDEPNVEAQQHEGLPEAETGGTEVDWQQSPEVMTADTTDHDEPTEDSIDVVSAESPELNAPDIETLDAHNEEAAEPDAQDEPELESNQHEAPISPETDSPEIETAEEPQLGDVNEQEMSPAHEGDSPALENVQPPDAGNLELQVDDQPDESAPEVAGEQPESVQPPELHEMPDISENETQLDDTSAQVTETPGFNGYIDEPVQSQTDIDRKDDLADPTMSHNERMERQFEWQQQVNEDLVSRLGQELGPVFEDMREQQVSAVHDYVTSQQLVSAMLRSH